MVSLGARTVSLGARTGEVGLVKANRTSAERRIRVCLPLWKIASALSIRSLVSRLRSMGVSPVAALVALGAAEEMGRSRKVPKWGTNTSPKSAG